MSHVTCHASLFFLFLFKKKLVELIGGGSVINGAYSVYLSKCFSRQNTIGWWEVPGNMWDMYMYAIYLFNVYFLHLCFYQHTFNNSVSPVCRISWPTKSYCQCFGGRQDKTGTAAGTDIIMPPLYVCSRMNNLDGQKLSTRKCQGLW